MSQGFADKSKGDMMPLMVLLRHGQSVWNAENRFTGWVDVDLSPKGIIEAEAAGDTLANICFDVVHTSALMRAQRTAAIVMKRNRASNDPPVHQNERLNERHYGALQGLNKDETREKHGDDQVHIWRRSFNVSPPEGESLEMCAERTLPYLHEAIIPDLEAGSNILVAAHGNSLRSIVMAIEDLTAEEILSVEIPTGSPIIYQFENKRFSRVIEP